MTIRSLTSQQPAPAARVERAMLQADVPGVGKSPTPGLSPDSIVPKSAASSLERRHAFAVLKAEDLLGILSEGALPADRADVWLDAVAVAPSRAVLQLSDIGKKALLEQPGSDRLAAQAPLTLDAGIEEILLSPRQKESLLKAYGEKVAKGEAPETIAGKPFQAYFDQHVRGTEDVLGDIELKNFRKLVPGFSELSPFEQKARASLAARMAKSLPTSIPGDVRRQMANTMIRHKTFDRPTPGAGLSTAGEIKQFFHGTKSGGLISRVGFRGQPEMLFNELPKGVQELMQNRLRVNFRSNFGAGVYYGNSSIASDYAFMKFDWKKPVQVVSGEVAVGKTTLEALDQVKDADTRLIPDAAAEGDYLITRDPRRFAIKGLTTMDPKQTDGLMRFFPEILKAYPDGPDAIGDLVDHLPEAPSRRALEEAFKGTDATTRKSATLLLARKGHEAALSPAVNLLKGAANQEEQELVMDTLIRAVQKVGPGQPKLTSPVVEALMEYGDGSVRLALRRDAIAPTLYRTLGDEVRPAFDRWGVTFQGEVASKGWADRALELFSKGLKRRL